MTEREAKLALAQQYSDFAKELMAMPTQLFRLNDQIADTVKAMIAEIDVLLNDVKITDTVRAMSIRTDVLLNRDREADNE